MAIHSPSGQRLLLIAWLGGWLWERDIHSVVAVAKEGMRRSIGRGQINAGG